MLHDLLQQLMAVKTRLPVCFGIEDYFQRKQLRDVKREIPRSYQFCYEKVLLLDCYGIVV